MNIGFLLAKYSLSLIFSVIAGSQVFKRTELLFSDGTFFGSNTAFLEYMISWRSSDFTHHSMSSCCQSLRTSVRGRILLKLWSTFHWKIDSF